MNNLDNLSTNLKDLEVNIEQFPNATSSHLIEKFIIVGYTDVIKKEMAINKIKSNIISKKIKYNDLDNLKSEEIGYLPSALSSISSLSNFNMANEKFIIEYFFPIPPTIYYCNKECSKNKESQITNIIYNMIEFQENIDYSGYAYSFYEKEIIELNKKESIIFYFPKAFIILTNYHYFYAFHKICEYLHKQFLSDKVEIPLEIQIYNIVNFIPCPLDNKIELSFFLDTDLSSIIKFNNYEEYKSHNKNYIDLKQLKLYKNSDINICKIFEYFSPETIIHIYLQFISDKECAFFSGNKELLHYVLFIFNQFYFPIYPNVMTYGLNPNRFYIDIDYQCTIYGFLCTYEKYESYNPFIKSTEKESNFLNIEDKKKYKTRGIEKENNQPYFIVDIDKGLFKESNNSDYESSENEETRLKKMQRKQNLFNYLENLMNENREIDGNSETTLDLLIKELYSKLKSLSILIKEKNLNSSFFIENEETENISKEILESFLRFNVLITNDYFNKFPNYKGGNKLEKDFPKKGDLNITELEFGFYEDFHKYTGNSLGNFFLLEDSIPEIKKVLKTSFDNLFTMCREDDNNRFLIKNHFIELLDCIIKENDRENVNISFFEFNKFFYDNLRSYIFKNINKDYVEKKIIKKNNINNYYYKYKKIDLDQNLFLIYSYYIDDLDINVKNKIFPTSVNIKNSLEPKIIHTKDFYNSYDKFFFEHHIFSFKNYIEFCILNIVVLSISELKFSQFAESIYSLIREMNFGIRKYVELILNVSYRILVKKHITDVNEVNKYFYIYKKILIEEKKMLPNTELLKIKTAIEKYIDAISEQSGNYSTNTSEEVPKTEEDNLFKFTPDIPDKNEFNIEKRETWEKEGEIKKKISLSSELLGNNEISSDYIYYPYTLYLKLNELVDQFYVSLDINSVDKDEYNKLIMNVIYYLRFIKEQFPNEIMKFLLLCIKK